MPTLEERVLALQQRLQAAPEPTRAQAWGRLAKAPLDTEGRGVFLPLGGKMPGVVAGAINAVTAPLRSASGPAYVQDEDGNVRTAFDAPEEAANLAGNVMGGGMASGPVSKGGTLGLFIGKKAKSWNGPLHDLALQMEKNGAHPREIWAETGNWKAKDGKWRQEIPDNLAEIWPQYTDDLHSSVKGHGIKYDRAATLGEVLKHDAYDVAYGKMDKTRIGTQPDKGARYSRVGDSIFVGPESGKSELAHELQHRIGYEEGFSPGTSPTAQLSKSGDHPYPPELESIVDEYRTLWRDLKGQDRPKKPVGFSRREFEIEDVFDTLPAVKDPVLRAKFEDVLNRLDTARQNYFGIDEGSIAKIRAEEAYRKAHGEAEARAVESRLNMTPEERRNTFPEKSFDIPYNETVVLPHNNETIVQMESRPTDLNKVRAAKDLADEAAVTLSQEASIAEVFDPVATEYKKGATVVYRNPDGGKESLVKLIDQDGRHSFIGKDLQSGDTVFGIRDSQLGAPGPKAFAQGGLAERVAALHLRAGGLVKKTDAFKATPPSKLTNQYKVKV